MSKKHRNNYGVTHGLASAGVIGLAWWLENILHIEFAVYLQPLLVPDVAAIFTIVINSLVAITAIATAGYWYQREKKARKKDGITRFKDWYPDSQWDAITPAIVSIAFVAIRYGGSIYGA